MADQETWWRPSSFEGFKFESVLAQDPSTGYLAVLGSFEGQDGHAVVKFNRQHFDMSHVNDLLGKDTILEKMTFENDIYSKYVARVPAEHAKVNVDLIHPATDKHIQKAMEQSMHMVQETPEMYQLHVMPFISSIPPARLQWVYNILEKKKEVERLIFEDPDPSTGFMLHPDMKWDEKVQEQLYCVAICHRHDIASLRSLTADHLPLLRNIRDKASQAVQQRFNVPASQLRLFVHYPPSYYHFHVHVIHVKANYGLGVAAGKAHLLDDIIDNIETFGSDYYQRRKLCLVLGENDELWQLLKPAAAS